MIVQELAKTWCNLDGRRIDQLFDGIDKWFDECCLEDWIKPTNGHSFEYEKYLQYCVFLTFVKREFENRLDEQKCNAAKLKACPEW